LFPSCFPFGFRRFFLFHSRALGHLLSTYPQSSLPCQQFPRLLSPGSGCPPFCHERASVLFFFSSPNFLAPRPFCSLFFVCGRFQISPLGLVLPYSIASLFFPQYARFFFFFGHSTPFPSSSLKLYPMFMCLPPSPRVSSSPSLFSCLPFSYAFFCKKWGNFFVTPYTGPPISLFFFLPLLFF